MASSFNETEKVKIAEAMAGKLVASGVTSSNFTFDKCKNVLSNCVLANKLILFFENNHEIVLAEIIKYEHI